MNKFEIHEKEAFLVIRDTHVLIDKEDVPRLNAFKWFLGSNGYVVAHLGSKPIRWQIYLHRFIMSFPSAGVIDHANRNRLDNRKINLRTATKSENRANSVKKETGTFFGVYGLSKSKNFRAQIGVEGKVKHLGTFNDEWKAACAYDDAAFERFGKFASLNIML